MSEPEKQPTRPAGTPTSLEQEEAWLWRIALFFVVLLATGLAAESWERLQSLPYHLGLLSIGLLCVAIAFAGFAYGRRKRVTELQTLVRGIQERATAPTDEQLDQLGELIARSQRSFKDLIDSFDDIAFATSLEGKIKTVNRRVTELLGIPYAEVVGHRIDEFLDEPKREDVDRGLTRFLEKRRWSGLVSVRLKSNARTLYFDCALNAIVKDDEIVGVGALARDVTEEREKERRFTELFETLQEGVYFSTPDGRLLDGNVALVYVLGFDSKEELLAINPRALNSDPNQNPVLGRSADDQGGVRTREITLRRKNGTLGVFLDTSRAVWDAGGKIVRYQGTLVDVTERREMEKTLRRQEEFQRYLLESFPDLILVIDLNGRYSFVSSRIHDLRGYKPEDLLGKRVEEEQDHAPQLLGWYRDLTTGRKMFGSCDYNARHRDGSWRTMRASASPLFDAENKLSGVIVSVRDITVEKKLEQQIIQSERLAAMGQMIGGFAHELNNPLTSILGMAELLQDCTVSEGARKQGTILPHHPRRAAEIVQNLQYSARPPAPGRSQVDLNELVQRMLQLQTYPLRKSNITVDYLPEPTIPAVVADPNQLMQVFLNLLLNAEQAIRESREKGTIRVRLGRGNAGSDAANPYTVWIVFQDDGPGIAPENLAHIFDPFFTTKRPGRGTGLGLSICKTVLREHGGNIEAASAPGGGAIFTITLPVGTTESGAAEKEG